MGTKKNIPTLNVAERIAFTIMWVFIFLLVALFLTAVAAFYLVAKISLAMVILIGPIFIGAMLFPATRQWGMNWIGQIMNYAVTVTFYVLIGTIQLAFFEEHMITMLNGAAETSGSENLFDIAMFFPMFFLFTLATIVFFVVVLSVPSIAAVLTGGATIGGYSGITRTISSISNYLDKKRNSKDKENNGQNNNNHAKFSKSSS